MGYWRRVGKGISFDINKKMRGIKNILGQLNKENLLEL